MSTLRDRFFKLAGVQAEGCWAWQGCKHPQGYGLIRNMPAYIAPRLAHRVSWELHFGPIPEGVLVLHRCDNPACSNPEHLFLGSHQDNSDDMVAKGRQAHAGGRVKGDPRLQGENHPRAKLTNAQRAAILTAPGSAREIAKEFGVAVPTIYALRSKANKNN